MAGLKTQIAIKFIQLPVFVWLVILLPAGTFDYWQVYVYFGAILVPAIIAIVYFMKHDPELIARRLRTREKEDTQKALVLGLLVIMIAGYMIPGFDRRFGWSNIPVPLVLVADVLVVSGYVFIAFVMKTNSYASRIVEVEEGQTVINSGPYAVIRHPMYAGVALMYIATPVALGSWWGLIPFSLLPLILAPRILNEEKVLKKGLDGYIEYCQDVRWRIIPFVW
jgi:protein-S-isoprenylcysteine O-methyltransferase Ste14